MRLVCALVLLCAALVASARPNSSADSAELLRESLSQMHQQGRRLMQGSSAVSRATGGQTASARAVAGPGVAATEQSATGAGSQVAGVSQVGQRVDACVRGPSTSAACQTLTTEDRSITCTDIAPPAVPGAEQFTCAQQAQFGKCDSAFIYLGAFCLQSCNRCGDQCADSGPTPDFSCALALCNTTEVAAGPFCLKTCGRCSQAAGSAQAQGAGGQGQGQGAGASAGASAGATSGTGAGR